MKNTLLIPFLLLLLACGGSDRTGEPVEDPPAVPPPEFLGTVVWQATAGGEDEEGAELFRGLAATTVSVTFGEDRVRIEEIGGMNAGVLLLLPGEGDFRWKALRLDPEKRTFERANWVNDLDDAAPEVKKTLPTTYATEVEPMGEKVAICGHPTEKVRIVKSAFVRPDAVAHVWIAKGISFPQVRVQADFEWNRVNGPLVLSFPGLPGAVLKAEVLENDVLVTWEATSVDPGPPAPSLFEIPEGYTDAED